MGFLIILPFVTARRVSKWVGFSFFNWIAYDCDEWLALLVGWQAVTRFG
jgi:hypothetical protein